MKSTSLTKVRIVAIAVLLTPLFAAASSSQDLHPSRRPSPMGMARITVDDAYIRVVYSRPYKRGRDHIFGTQEEEALVPYGTLWRLGANEATEITVTRDVWVGDSRLPAGTYSVFATPGPTEWKIHFNSALGLSGTARPNPETGRFESAYTADNDVVAVTAATKTLDEEVAQFTITFTPEGEGAHMVLQWITTEVRVPFRVAD